MHSQLKVTLICSDDHFPLYGATDNQLMFFKQGHQRFQLFVLQ